MFGLFTVNRLFKPKKNEETIIGLCYEGTYENIEYGSHGEKYEAKNDYYLSQRFQFLTRVGIRVRMIVSEVGIMGLIICQSLILVF